MFGKLKFYVHFLVTFKFLFFHAFQKLFSILKHFLRLDPPYDFQKNPEFDTHTKLTLEKIYNQRQQGDRDLNLDYKAHWDSIFDKEEIGNAIVKLINNVIPFGRSEKFLSCNEKLNEIGYSIIPKKLKPAEIEKVLSYLETRKCSPLI